MKADELNKWKSATSKEKQEKIEQLTAELFSLNQQLRLGQLKNYRSIRRVKRDIAQLRTLLRQSNVGASYGNTASASKS